jgi:dinuclear metal center YbgI/SA1388 family protein
MTCLTVTPEVVAEAVAGNVNLIISHHPILFRGAKKLTTSTADGRIVWPLAKAGISVYSPHTAFDNCIHGINETLASNLGLTNIGPLRTREGQGQFKLVVFVPESDSQKVSDAIFAAGGGVIGQYEHCSFRIPGTGTFFGSDKSNPVVGERGRLEEIHELRLEVVVPKSKIEAVIPAMRKAHSYEEPAFDIYPLRANNLLGEGRIGTLEQPVSLEVFAIRVKHVTKAHTLQTVGDSHKPITRVAVACGAAGEFLADAIRAKADAFVTGEVRFHDGIQAEDVGIALVLPGHYATERPAVEELAKRLQTQFPTTTTWASVAERDPFR